MHDPNDQEAIRQDLQRLRDLLESCTLDEDSRTSLHQLIQETADRLAEIEAGAKTD